MAATEAPDPRSLSSADEAFRYPVVTVRAMERKLRSSVAENQERLRGLVGASYRDLLDTARTIIHADGQLRRADVLLTRSARAADARNFERLARNAARLDDAVAQRTRTEREVQAHLFAIDRCAVHAARLQRSRTTAGAETSSDTLLAAKLRVLAQILRQSLARSHPNLPQLHALTGRLDGLRARFAGALDRRLGGAVDEPRVLVEDLAAYCFVNRLTGKDALGHFLRVREGGVLDASTSTSASGHDDDDDTETGESTPHERIMHRLRLFLSTLHVSRSIFPDLLPASLKRLAAQPLVEDPALLSVRQLRLDVTAPLFAHDVQAFVPWTRANTGAEELSARSVDAALKAWAGRVLAALPGVLEQDLSGESDPTRLTKTRHDALQHFLSARGSARGLLPRDALAMLQRPFVARLEGIAADAALRLGADVAGAVEAESARAAASADSADRDEEEETQGLWSPALQSLPLSEGASAFRSAVLGSRTGRTSALSRVQGAWSEASARVLALQGAVEGMRDVRWEDDFDEDSGSDDHEDEGEDEAVFAALSRRDPALVQSRLSKELLGALTGLEGRLNGSSPAGDDDSETHAKTALLLLRSTRLLRAGTSSLLERTSTPLPQTALCAPLASTLLKTLSQQTLSLCTPTVHQSLQRFAARPLAQRALWDNGTPSLPVLPGSWSVRYLRALVAQMGGCGSDVWSVEGVRVVRGGAWEGICAAVGRMLQEEGGLVRTANGAEKTSDEKDDPAETTETKTEDDDEKNEGESQKDEEKSETPPSKTEDKVDPQAQADKATQLLFDMHFLQAALCPDAEQSPPVLEKLTALAKASEQDVARMGKAAKESWRRSHLLFGLLCV